jgi:hypothetical protein
VKRHVTLDEGMLAEQARSIDILALDEVLTRLSTIDERQARLSGCGSSPASVSKRPSHGISNAR